MRTCLVAFVAGIALTMGAFGQNTGTLLTARIDELRMTGGHLPGAFLENRQAGGFRWYFNSIAVQAIAADNRHDPVVRAYLDKYLATATLPGAAIDDVHDLTNPNIIRWKVSDSDDSYAALILSLSSWYAQRPGGKTWFAKNLGQLKVIATNNLLGVIDPKTMLIATYNNRPGRFRPEDQGAKGPYQSVCQTFDNCEAYRGLKDFGDQLARIGDGDSAKYLATAAKVAQGVAGMYDAKNGAFRTSTISNPNGPIRFYPDRLIQVGPIVYGVPLGPNTKAMNDSAWQFLNAGGDQWWTGQIKDQSNDGAPLMVLSFAAALRGDKRKASQQLEWFEKMLKNPGTPVEYGKVHELGFALKAYRQIRR